MIENKLNFFFKYQIWHIIGLIVLFYVSLQIINFKNGSNFFLGISSEDWFLFAMISPFLHQIYTWLSWRSELCWKTISNTIGFRTYSIIFYILLVIRMLFGIGLAFADYGTWFNPGWIEWTISLLFFVPFIYTMYSVKKYFGFDRATGIDHFDSNYKNIPFVKKGIFVWTPNAMYIFGLAVFFGFAFSSGSKAMFVYAAYTYITIWLHYFCTEKEDFKIIYENS